MDTHLTWGANSPNCFFQNRFIIINHVIGFGENRILEKQIGVKKEFKLKTLWIIYSVPLDILQILQCCLIPFLDLNEIAKIFNREGNKK